MTDRKEKPGRLTPLAEEFRAVINRASREEDSNTPDFILADFMLHSLEAFELANNRREVWYGVEHTPDKRTADAKAI